MLESLSTNRTRGVIIICLSIHKKIETWVFRKCFLCKEFLKDIFLTACIENVGIANREIACFVGCVDSKLFWSLTTKKFNYWFQLAPK